MKNHNRRNNVFVDVITPDKTIPVSKVPVGTADKNSFCIYNNQDHAVGSIINNRDGKYVCTPDGSWKEEQ